MVASGLPQRPHTAGGVGDARDAATEALRRKLIAASGNPVLDNRPIDTPAIARRPVSARLRKYKTRDLLASHLARTTRAAQKDSTMREAAQAAQWQLSFRDEVLEKERQAVSNNELVSAGKHTAKLVMMACLCSARRSLVTVPVEASCITRWSRKQR